MSIEQEGQLTVEESSVEQKQRELVDALKEATESKDTAQIKALMQELTDITIPKEKREPAKIPDIQEIIKVSQKVYETLGFQVDLQRELQEGNILLPPPEQKEAIDQEAMTFSFLMDPRISRQDLVSKAKTYLEDKHHSEGIYLGDQAKEDLNQTDHAQTSHRPDQPYFIYLRPEKEVRETEIEMGKTFPQYQEILDQKNTQNPDLNLKGLTMEECLLVEVAADLEGFHFESQTWTWLLEEQVLDKKGLPVRCLYASWYVDGVGVNSDDSSIQYSNKGARFAAVPKV